MSVHSNSVFKQKLGVKSRRSAKGDHKPQDHYQADHGFGSQRHGSSDHRSDMRNMPSEDSDDDEHLELYEQMLNNSKNKNSKKLFCTIDGCNKEFSSRFCLKRHFMTIHCKQKKFRCKECGRCFA